MENVLNCELEKQSSNLVSAACINQKIYLFQKNSENNNVTVFYSSDGILMNQSLFETTICPARIAVRDIDCDGRSEMAVIGNDSTDFFRLENKEDISSWLEIHDEQIADTCLSKFTSVIFLKLPGPEIFCHPIPKPPSVLKPLISATVFIAAVILYQPICQCFRVRKKCLA
jgi:hypothetical protein